MTANASVFTIANPNVEQKILILSIPKCGTYLVKKLVTLLTGKQSDYREAVFGGSLLVHNVNELHSNNKFTHDHLPYSADDEEILIAHDIKTIFIYRDPRDYAVSFAFYVVTNPFWNSIEDLTFDGRLLDLIAGDRIYGPLWPNIIGVDHFYRAFLPWGNNQNFCTVRFEDLVGPLGGGSLQAQLSEIRKITSYLGYTVTPDELLELSKALFGGTATFRKGEIGSWRDHFTRAHTAAFKEVASRLLGDLGYERHSDW
jgi:sulfotransferase 6B1